MRSSNKNFISILLALISPTIVDPVFLMFGMGQMFGINGGSMIIIRPVGLTLLDLILMRLAHGNLGQLNLLFLMNPIFLVVLIGIYFFVWKFIISLIFRGDVERPKN